MATNEKRREQIRIQLTFRMDDEDHLSAFTYLKHRKDCTDYIVKLVMKDRNEKCIESNSKALQCELSEFRSDIIAAVKEVVKDSLAELSLKSGAETNISSEPNAQPQKEVISENMSFALEGLSAFLDPTSTGEG